MTIFHAQSEKGQLSLGSEYNTARFRQFLKKNEGIRLKIEPLTPESDKQRKYFEGCLVPLVTYYQENKDHRNHDDREEVREWLKHKFCPKIAIVNGEPRVIAQSSKGRLKILIERVIDWLEDNYAPPFESISPEAFKHYRDEIYSYSNYETYIDYLISLHILE